MRPRRFFAHLALALAVLAVAMSSAAESVSSMGFRIEIEDGWEHRIEPASGADYAVGDLIRIQRPNGSGLLSLRSYASPRVVDSETLRNMTNVPIETQLTPERWGDYAGFQLDYVEGASFYRQWWLANDSTLVLITYQCDAGMSDLETDAIDRMVASLSVSTP
jgi:hypothetical protein